MKIDPEKLISLYLNNNEKMSDELLRQLNDWLKEDIKHVRQFAYASFVHSSIHDILLGNDIQKRVSSAEQTDSEPLLKHDSSYEHEFWEALSEAEKTSPVLELPSEEPENQIVKMIKVDKASRRINKASLLTAVTSIAALIFVLVYVHLNPKTSQEVATLTDSINTEWDSHLSLEKGERISDSRESFDLLKGIIKITTDEDVDILIEGPAKFNFVTSSELNLIHGRLFARVSELGVGFSVTTRNAKIVDLGTIFGVRAKINGDTELHVYKGKTNLVSGTSRFSKHSQVVEEGKAKCVSRDNSEVQDISLRHDFFVKQINSRSQLTWRGQSLNLADILGGGNGFGLGKKTYGINPAIGRTCVISEYNREVDNKYIAVPDNRFIDGVFVPNGTTDQIISSIGHKFKECPATTGVFYTEIVNTPGTIDRAELVLGNVNYSKDQASCLFLHTNLGITFDLDEIRSLLPNTDLVRFQSKIGISETAWRECNADFWILVDGKVRYKQEKVKRKGVIDFIDIRLSENDRFLTLITTDGGDPDMRTVNNFPARGIDSDWCVFAEPVLVME